MTKIEMIFMIITHTVGLTNLFVVLGYLAKKAHAALITRYLNELKSDFELRLQKLESTIKQPTSAASLVASSSQGASQQNQSASYPSSV